MLGAPEGPADEDHGGRRRRAARVVPWPAIWADGPFQTGPFGPNPPTLSVRLSEIQATAEPTP